MNHRITIGLPVYNRTDYFREALESAINQTVRCPVLVIDNNSPHHDFKRIIDEYNDPYIKYVRTEETVPQDENFNNCFRHAETEWVSVLHDDDLLHTQFVEFSHQLLDKYSNQIGGISYWSKSSDTEWKEMNSQLQLTSKLRILKPGYHFFYTLAFPGNLVKKDTAMRIGGFRSGIFPIADADFWYRYNSETPFLLVEQELSYYRISESQSTTKVIGKMINNIYNFRIKILKERNAYNLLNKFGLEFSRVENVAYFKQYYPDMDIDVLIDNKKTYSRFKILLRFPLVSKIVFKYMSWISYRKPRTN